MFFSEPTCAVIEFGSDPPQDALGRDLLSVVSFDRQFRDFCHQSPNRFMAATSGRGEDRTTGLAFMLTSHP